MVPQRIKKNPACTDGKTCLHPSKQEFHVILSSFIKPFNCRENSGVQSKFIFFFFLRATLVNFDKNLCCHCTMQQMLACLLTRSQQIGGEAFASSTSFDGFSQTGADAFGLAPQDNSSGRHNRSTNYDNKTRRKSRCPWRINK